MTNTPTDLTGCDAETVAMAVDSVESAVAAVVSASAILQAIDPTGLPDSAVEALAHGVERARRMNEATAVQVAADVDAQRRFRDDDGVLSTHAWLRHRRGLSGAEAQRRLQVARFLERAPQWKYAFANGLIGIAQVEAMARGAANPRIADVVLESALDDLLDDARSDGFDDFAQKARDWERLADADGARDRHAQLHEQRNVSLRPRQGGGWRLSGSFDDLAGAELAEVVAYFADAEWRADQELERDDPRRRTTEQQFADALVAMANAAAGTDPGARRANPTVNVLIDEASFEAAIHGESVHPSMYRDVTVRTQSGHRLHPDDAINAALVGHIRRVVYDSQGVVTDSQGVVTDLGRRSRLFTGAAREAVMLLETECAWAGCNRPVSWCDADHSLGWAAHGSTVPRNGAPLCRAHNLQKERGFRVHRDANGRWHTHRPDGTEIT
ncbi:MAG: DUF222 domain-containing protein [Actinomycetota bacterium]